MKAPWPWLVIGFDRALPGATLVRVPKGEAMSLLDDALHRKRAQTKAVAYLRALCKGLGFPPERADALIAEAKELAITTAFTPLGALQHLQDKLLREKPPSAE